MLDLPLTPAKELYSFWRVSKISCSALSPFEQLNGIGSGTLPQMSSCGLSRIYFGPSPVPAMVQNPFTDFRLLRFLAKSYCQVPRRAIGDSLRRRFDVAYWRPFSVFSPIPKLLRSCRAGMPLRFAGLNSSFASQRSIDPSSKGAPGFGHLQLTTLYAEQAVRRVTDASFTQWRARFLPI